MNGFAATRRPWATHSNSFLATVLVNHPAIKAASRRTLVALIPLSIAAVTILCFLPALRNGFVAWDDETNFIQNPHYRGLGATQLHWMWTTTLMGHYVPLSWMSLGLDYDLWGMNPGGYHLTSILIHGANAVLVYFIARRILRYSDGTAFDQSASLTAAAIAAALGFALHPLRVESVAWATERRDVLSCLFFFASILSYLRFIGDPRRSRRWYISASSLFAASLLSKATTMTLPAVLVLINMYPLKRLDLSSRRSAASGLRVLGEVLPFAVIAGAAAIFSIVALNPPDQLPMAAKLAVSMYSIAFYVWKTLAPVNLSPLYEMPLHVDPLAWKFLAGYGVVLIITYAVWHLRHRYPSAGAAWIAFVIITSPMLGIVQNGPQIAADRYTYYSAAVLSILGAGWLFSWTRLSMRGQALVAVGMLIPLGIVTWRQTSVWHDSTTLWSRVLHVDEQSAFGHVGIARVDFARGDLDGAIQHYRRASELLPTYSEGYNNIGNAMAIQGRLDDAIQQYQHALAIKSTSPEVRNNWGSVLAREGKFEQAIEQFRLAVALKPTYAAAHSNLGAALVQLGNVQAGLDEYERALNIDSTYADAHVHWANALARIGKPDLAAMHYAAAFRLRPGDASIQRNWGAVLAQEGDFAAAIAHFREAVALEPENAESRADLERAIAIQARGRSESR